MTDAFTPAGSPRREQFPSGAGQKPKSTTIDVTKPRPEPEPAKRADGVRQERRRRQDTGETSGRKLHIPAEALDPRYEYRWFLDEPGRMYAKTQRDDWDPVSMDQLRGRNDESLQAEGGTRVARFAEKSASAGNQPRKMFLARKLKELYQEDKAKDQRALKEREDAMKRSPTPVPGGVSGPTAYIPNRSEGFSDGEGQNSVERG